ncbi:MAG: (2Fe-2S)-binding protein [Dehalococcoidia bacterium]|nr:(2Fe-2S)-binding protein [Dehalococcoidia bacterium]
MKVPLSLTVNGEEHHLEVEPRRTLLEVLREYLSLTGARRGCEENFCGACTVLLDGQAVHSCSVLAIQARGREVTTIEGLATNGRLHPLQEAFVEYGALQCGYCTPGVILSATALLAQKPQPTEIEVRQALVGNLCRCTGYVKIVQAIMAAAEKIQGRAP